MGSQTVRIILIDSDSWSHAQIHQTLEQNAIHHYDLLIAETAANGLTLCHEPDKPPDCVLVDAHLPDMSVVDLLSAMRAGGDTLPYPVIVLTEILDDAVEGQAVLALGAQEYLCKSSITSPRLIWTITHAIEHFRLHQRVRQNEDFQQRLIKAFPGMLQVFDRQDQRSVPAKSDAPLDKNHIEILQHNAEFVQGVLDSLPEHIVVLNKQGVVIAANEPWQRFAQENGGDMSKVSVGSNYLEVCRHSYQSGDLLAKQALDGVAAVIADQHEEFALEYPCPTPTRERWFLMQALKVRYGVNGVNGIIISHLDITERKQVEEQLRLTTERFQLALQNSSIMVFSEDLNLRFTWIYNPNQAIAAENIVGKRDDEVIEQPQDATMLMSLKREVITTGMNQRREIVIHKQSLAHWFDIQVEPAQDPEGNIVGVHGVVVEITERKRHEEELRQAHDKLENVLNSISDGLAVIDQDWNYTYFNKQGARLIGKNPEDMVGKCVWDVFPQVQGSKMHDFFQQAVESHTPVHFEEYYPEPINKWLESRCYPCAEGLTVYFQDVTERKQAEAALEQNTKLFSTLIEHAPTGMYVVDAEFRLYQINPRALPTFGSIRPLIGQDFHEILKFILGSEVGDQCAGIFRHTLETGERYYNPEFIANRQDLGTQQAFEWETQRVVLPDGQYGVVCYFWDVTERVHTEKAIRESDHRVRLAAESTGVGIWEWNVATGKIHWDAQMFRQYGVEPTPDGLVDYETWRAAVVPEDLPQQEATLRETLRTCGKSRRTFRIRRQYDGAWRTVESVETVRANAQGKAQWVVGTSLDITERVNAEQKLKEMDRRKDEFLATLAHELRNPLAPLLNAVHLLKIVSGKERKFDGAQQMIERQVKHLMRLVDDLLDMNRITSGKLELRRERIELLPVIEAGIEAAKHLIEQARHELIVEMPEETIIIDGDATRITQAVTNLLNNAAKYTHPGGHIRLVVQRQDQIAVISISDDGIGIPPAMLGKVFDMFTQVDRTLEKTTGGLGIGLSLVKGLIEMHGGTIEARSEGESRGSEFIIRLPILELVLEPQHDNHNTTVFPTRRRRVLVVDDNMDSAESMSQLLELLGHEVQTAHDGEEAVERARQYQPELVLMDIGMPRMNGYDAARKIRGEEWGKDIILVALTGWGQDDDRRKSAAAGFNHHLLKPIDSATILKLLNALS